MQGTETGSLWESIGLLRSMQKSIVTQVRQKRKSFAIIKTNNVLLLIRFITCTFLWNERGVSFPDIDTF